jgi:hypothetical protein
MLMAAVLRASRSQTVRSVPARLSACPAMAGTDTSRPPMSRATPITAGRTYRRSSRAASMVTSNAAAEPTHTERVTVRRIPSTQSPITALAAKRRPRPRQVSSAIVAAVAPT